MKKRRKVIRKWPIEWIWQNLGAVWLLFLKLRYRPSQKFYCCALNVCSDDQKRSCPRRQGFRIRPDKMVGGYLRELRPSRNSLHHLPNLGTPSGQFSHQTKGNRSFRQRSVRKRFCSILKRPVVSSQTT